MSVMRKGYKVKRHSCAMCKPHKMAWAHRFKEKDRFLLKLHDKEMRSARQH
jgi:hypothetical protein